MIGRQHHDRGGMRVLLGLGIELILEAYSLRERVDLIRFAGQKMPALIGSGAAEALHDVALFCRSHFGGLTRVEAYSDDVEILADVKGQRLHRADQPFEKFAAEHGALVVAQIQNDRPSMAEIFGEPDWAAESL